MKKILLSLFWIITLWLINFSNAETYDFVSYDQELIISSTSDIYLRSDFYNSPVICFDTMSPGWAGAVSFNWNMYNLVWQFITCYMFLNDIPYHLDIWWWSIRVKMYFDSSTIDNEFSVSCDYSQYESQINTLSWNLATCQSDFNELNLNCNSLDSSYKSCLSNLSTCQSDLSSCQNSNVCDYSWYESQINTLSWNLATCQWMYDRLDSDYDLLEWNYNTCTSELSSCMQNWWSSWSGDIQWSSIFINQVQHLWNKNIYIDIPLEYEFSYTNEWENFEITVEWLNQDEEYLSWVINKQNYIPTTEDFSNVFSNLGLFGSLLVVCLFVILVFYMIKKVFN